MGAQIREYRQRIRSVSSIKKITRAMELMAASRVVKARQRVEDTTPYAQAITRALSACATHSDIEHPLTSEADVPCRAAVLIVASDRGLAGAYSASVLKESEQLVEKLRQENKEVVPYLYGRKAASFYKFRRREFAEAWRAPGSLFLDSARIATSMSVLKFSRPRSLAEYDHHLETLIAGLEGGIADAGAAARSAGTNTATTA